jgi:hypothetical protein
VATLSQSVAASRHPERVSTDTFQGFPLAAERAASGTCVETL